MNTITPKPFCTFFHPYCPPLHLPQLSPSLSKQGMQVGKKSNTRTTHNWSDKKIPSFSSSLAFTFSLCQPLSQLCPSQVQSKGSCIKTSSYSEFRGIYTHVHPPGCIYTPHYNPTCNTMPKKKHTDVQYKMLTDKEKKTSCRQNQEGLIWYPFLSCDEFLGVSITHLSVLSSIKHQPKL